MPPKQQEQKPSKKAVRDKKAQALEDMTFGMKNKNKSSKVKLFIERAEKAVKAGYGNNDIEAQKAKEAKKEAKLAKMLQEEELRILLGEGIANQSGKKKADAKAEAEKLGLTKQKDEVAQLLETFSSDSEDGDDDDPDSGVIYVPDEPVAVEVFREKTIEDIIEEQRAKLAAEGKVGTPVTEASFAKWRADKLVKRQAEAEARVKAEQAKKKGGKGLSVLSGKELFNYNASLFVDDDAAIDAAEENALAVETKKNEEEEERREKEEAERAQQEQMRLMEVQRLEEEARLLREEERRQLAAAADRVIFQLGDISINQIVFDVEDKEDLFPFEEVEVDDDEDDDDAGAAAHTIGESDDDDEEDDDEEDGDDDQEDESDDDDDDGEEEEEGGREIEGAGSAGAAVDDDAS